MIIKRTHNNHCDFLTLTRELDTELRGIYGSLQTVYDFYRAFSCYIYKYGQEENETG